MLAIVVSPVLYLVMLPASPPIFIYPFPRLAQMFLFGSGGWREKGERREPGRLGNIFQVLIRSKGGGDGIIARFAG